MKKELSTEVVLNEFARLKKDLSTCVILKGGDLKLLAFEVAMKRIDEAVGRLVL